MSKLLATDLDGTLMYPTRIRTCIPKKNIKFCREWIDKGNKLVIVSSRGYDYMDRLKEEIQRDFDSITYTASHIVADNKVIKDVCIDKEELTKALNIICEKYHPRALLLSAKNQPMIIKNVSIKARFLLFFYLLWWVFQFKRKEKFIVDNDLFDSQIQNGECYKVMVFFGLRKRKYSKMAKELNKEFRNLFPNIECSWTVMVNELTPLHCTKSEGLKDYCELLNINKEDVYVVGDSGNDITMFQDFYKNSYVMHKAFANVKKYAAHQIHRVYKLGKLVLEKE